MTSDERSLLLAGDAYLYKWALLAYKWNDYMEIKEFEYGTTTLSWDSTCTVFIGGKMVHGLLDVKCDYFHKKGFGIVTFRKFFVVSPELEDYSNNDIEIFVYDTINNKICQFKNKLYDKISDKVVYTKDYEISGEIENISEYEVDQEFSMCVKKIDDIPPIKISNYDAA